MKKQIEPIKEWVSIEAIKNHIKSSPRDIALFTLGISLNMDLQDLLNIKICQVDKIEPGGSFEISEKKSGLNRRISINNDCIEVIDSLLFSMMPYNSEDFLFQNTKGGQLSIPIVSKLVKKWCLEANIHGVFSGSTLRKTWGYIQKTTYNTAMETLQLCLHHSSIQETAKYLCLGKEK